MTLFIPTTAEKSCRFLGQWQISKVFCTLFPELCWNQWAPNILAVEEAEEM